jgi:hypothetical protein
MRTLCGTLPVMSRPVEASVFVNWIDLDADLWDAVWQQGSEHRSYTGSRDACVAWARSQEADRYWVFDGDGFVPLEPSGPG